MNAPPNEQSERGRPGGGSLKPRARGPEKGVEPEVPQPWAVWTIRVEFQRHGPNHAPVVVALLQARTPRTDLINLAQVTKGALELIRARGFNREDGEFKARPMVEFNRQCPATPPDWNGHRLELWFTKFTEEANPGGTA